MSVTVKTETFHCTFGHIVIHDNSIGNGEVGLGIEL